jgi:hypothetical protein
MGSTRSPATKGAQGYERHQPAKAHLYSIIDEY